MKKIAIIQSGPSWFGGAQAIAVWAISALFDEYDVYVYTYRDIDISRVNLFYGTNLDSNMFEVRKIPYIWPSYLAGKAKFFEHHWAMTYMNHESHKYDIVFSTRGEMNIDGKCIQYIHSPSITTEHSNNINYSGHIDEPSVLRKSYKTVVKWIFGDISEDDMKNNTTIVNSQWTCNKIREAYNIKPSIIYPPVDDNFPCVEWSRKKNSFLSIGRISPSKRIFKIIRILQGVRDEGYDIVYTIVGSSDSNKYLTELRNFIEDKDWIKIYSDVGRETLKKLASESKYGIHGKNDEHFGISVAEMVHAGCIVFVPNGGGQIEIVNDNRLIYDNVDEGVNKICRVLSSVDIQRDVLSQLDATKTNFTVSKFKSRIRKNIKKHI